jgi:hypothetical protein
MKCLLRELELPLADLAPSATRSLDAEAAVSDHAAVRAQIGPATNP